MRPWSQVGVARGPSPVESSKSAFHFCVHSSRPLLRSYAATTSSLRLCSIVYALPSATTNEACPTPTGCFQSIGSPFAGHFVAMGVSSYLPSRPGPRKWVQYFLEVAGAAAACDGDAATLACGEGVAAATGALVGAV